MKGSLLSGKKAGTFLLNNMVPIMFIVIGGIGIVFSGFSGTAIMNEMMIKTLENSIRITTLLPAPYLSLVYYISLDFSIE